MSRLAAIVIALFVIAEAVPLAAAEPADSAIKGALYDIERAEGEVRGLTPSRAANIKRLTRTMAMTRERLEGSTNQDHPSYIEAEERLSRLERALADLAAGKMPGEEPAPTAAEETPAVVPLDLPAEPADPAVASAQKELSRIGTEVDQIGPGDTALIKRYTIQLNQVAGRLNDVADKSTPSFTAAAGTYNALAERLKQLAAAPADQAPATADTAPTQPATPADPAIESVQKELTRIGAEVEKMEPDNKALLKRYRIQLNQVAEKLKKIGGQSHPSYVEAVKGYNTLNQKLNAMIAAVQGGGATSGTASSDDGAPADPSIGRAERELGMIQAQMRNMRANDKRLIERFVRDLARIDAELAAADQSHPSWAEVKAQHSAIVGTLLDAQAGTLTAELQRVIDQVNQFQPLQFLIAADVNGIRQAFGNIRGQADELQSPDHPSIATLLGNVTSVSNAFEERVQAAETEHAKLGDVYGLLAAVDERVRFLDVPRAIQAGAPEEEIRAYAEGIAKVVAHVQQDLAYLESVEGKTPLTVDQGNNFRRGLHVLRHEKPQQLNQSVEQSMYAVDTHVEASLDTLAFLASTEPTDINHQMNRLLGEGQYQDNRQNLVDGLGRVALAMAFDTAIGRTDGPDRAAQKATLEQGIVAWDETYLAALDASRMPEARSDDSDLLDTAEEVLNKEYPDVTWERMVVNYDVHRREKKTGDINSGTVTTTITVYHYIWDEYEVTTAEKVGDEYYLFHTDLRHYYQGDNDTPLNRWYITGRAKGMKILEENIDE
jgi:hypothetical protein